jgi:hypothetical protein
VELLVKVPRTSNGEFFSKDQFIVDLDAMALPLPGRTGA